MKMEICRHDIKCDFYGCRNLAKYAFSTKGFLKRELVFCEECMKQMYALFGETLVPKGVESPFNKRKRKERT